MSPSHNLTLRRTRVSHSGLTPAQRNGMVAAIAVLHGVGVWGLLQVREVRVAVAQAVPMFVEMIAPEPERPVPVPPPPPRTVTPPRRPPPPPMITAAPSPAPATAMVAPPPAPPEPIPAPVQEAVAPPAPPAPTPPAQPKTIPASAVRYIEQPNPQYPAASRRFGEEGTVVARIYIDEAGLPHNVEVVQSSGHRRLDDTWVAALNKARFRPYTENGRAIPVWTTASINFALEK